MANNSSDKMIGFRAIVLAAFVVVSLLGFAHSRPSGIPNEPNDSALLRETQQDGQATRRRSTKYRERKQRRDDTQFSHRTPEHQQSCATCHAFPSKNWKEARQQGEAFPDVTDYPEHASCLKCHRQQFYARERPAPRICSVCHIRITPRYTARLPFPNLTRTGSEFGIGFPHESHIEIVSQHRPGLRREQSFRFVAAAWRPKGARQDDERASKSCAVCHQTYQPQGDSDEEYSTNPRANPGDGFWLKKGTFKTAPRNHATCFTCHSDETGIEPLPSSCNSCHKLSPQVEDLPADFDPRLAAAMGITDETILSIWRGRHSAGAFRHEGGMHPTLNCTACHNVGVMNTLDAKTLRVPVQSCGGDGAGCHITAMADDGGILNYEVAQRKSTGAFQCAKCHIVFGRAAIPDDHLKAIALAPPG